MAHSQTTDPGDGGSGPFWQILFTVVFEMSMIRASCIMVRPFSFNLRTYSFLLALGREITSEVEERFVTDLKISRAFSSVKK